jgi:hypothetical protein
MNSLDKGIMTSHDEMEVIQILTGIFVEKEEDFCRLVLSKGQCALIDREDIDRVQKYGWYAHPKLGEDNYYARRNRTRGEGGGCESLSNFIMGLETPSNSVTVEYVNHRSLDNRKTNLRLVETNRTVINGGILKNKIPGVTLLARKRCWVASWYVDKKKKTKYFSFRDDGLEAKNKAIAYRQKIERILPIYNKALVPL